MGLIRDALKIVDQNRNAYLIINAFYYGLIVVGAIYAAMNPDLRRILNEAVVDAFTLGPLSPLGQAYSGGQVLMAMALTFLVNLGLGSFIWITLPSLIIPFSGIATGAYRAVLWGILFSPVPFERYLVPHWLTLILEGQGYILAMLASYIQGRAVINPSSIGHAGRKGAYIAGIKITAKLYLLVAIILAVAAVYEVLEVIFLIPMLKS